jgi:B-cell receptor-associated protein 31
MTIQWTVISMILYIEVAMALVLLVPWIRPMLWRRFFNSGIVQFLKKKGNIYANVALAVLVLLFVDSIREIRNYTDMGVDPATDTRHGAGTDSLVHMRLFRAQRNLYISGFSLLLFLVNKRIIGLLYRSAHLEAAAEGALTTAVREGSERTPIKAETDTAVSMCEENDKLREQLIEEERAKEEAEMQANSLKEKYDDLTEVLDKYKGGNVTKRANAERNADKATN